MRDGRPQVGNPRTVSIFNWWVPENVARFLQKVQEAGGECDGYYTSNFEYAIVELLHVKVYVKGGGQAAIAINGRGKLSEELISEGVAIGFSGTELREGWTCWGFTPQPTGDEAPSPAPPTFDYDSLNFGIRRVVRLLHNHGFETTDSGDGKTHLHPCDREYPYIVIRTTPETMVRDSHRVREALGPLSTLDNVHIQANYSPLDGIALIDLSGLDDGMLTANT